MTACRQRRSGCGPIRLLGRQPARRAGKNFPMLHWMQALSPAAAAAKRQAEALVSCVLNSSEKSRMGGWREPGGRRPLLC
jgi:hypothetical protein